MTGKRRIPGVRDIIDLQIHARGYSAFLDIEIFRLKSAKLQHASTDEENLGFPLPIFACKFCPIASSSHIVASCDEVGKVALLYAKKPFKTITQLQAHNNAIFDVVWTPNGRKLLTMSGDHSIQLLDVGDAQLKAEASFIGHTKSVKAADFSPSDPAVFASGARDGNIFIWDSRSSKKIESIFRPDQVIANAGGSICSQPSSVTSVAFKDSFNLISCGSSDNCIRIYDMRKTHCTWKESVPKTVLSCKKHGFTDLKLNPQRTKLYASNINNNIVCFNLNSENHVPIAEFSGHSASSFYVKTHISSDGRYLLSGSTDCMVYIWNTEKAEFYREPIPPMAQLSGHFGEVMGVNMIQHGRTMVASCADDGAVRIWTPEHPSNTEKLDPTPVLLRSLVENFNKLATPRTLISTTKLPQHNGKRKIQEISPTKLNERNTSARVEEFRSPTMNLPNYVLEGTGPSHSCPRTKQKENKEDWLTEIKNRSAGKPRRSTRPAKRRLSLQDTKISSKETLLNYYKKSNRGTEESVQKN